MTLHGLQTYPGDLISMFATKLFSSQLQHGSLLSIDLDLTNQNKALDIVNQSEARIN